jgi:hypothetical protein
MHGSTVVVVHLNHIIGIAVVKLLTPRLHYFDKSVATVR